MLLLSLSNEATEGTRMGIREGSLNMIDHWCIRGYYWYKILVAKAIGNDKWDQWVGQCAQWVCCDYEYSVEKSMSWIHPSLLLRVLPLPPFFSPRPFAPLLLPPKKIFLLGVETFI